MKRKQSLRQSIEREIKRQRSRLELAARIHEEVLRLIKTPNMKEKLFLDINKVYSCHDIKNLTHGVNGNLLKWAKELLQMNENYQELLGKKMEFSTDVNRGWVIAIGDTDIYLLKTGELNWEKVQPQLPGKH